MKRTKDSNYSGIMFMPDGMTGILSYSPRIILVIESYCDELDFRLFVKKSRKKDLDAEVFGEFVITLKKLRFYWGVIIAPSALEGLFNLDMLI